MYVIIKIFVSALIIALVTEISRRFPTYGGIVAALPLVSLLSMIWLHIQGEHTSTINKFALGVLWGFPATAILLLIVYTCLKNSLHLVVSIGFGIGGWFMFVFLQELTIKYVKNSFLN
ncbi:DUF3147 family protein [Fictibacillus nanhaiensis]|uniref:DUF3147 family protein n=1 Tax=Fictibacillus nanhaiensis TaxID=742169 RepID=UPI001C97547B|nr:DUF3147 family protein [Fictibacillus nanhaiensis]MBY6036630.1 DUF3147 family protein [Fictibacillus nanhaiensis]